MACTCNSQTTISKSDVLQQAPAKVISGDSYTFSLEVFNRVGGQIESPISIDVDSADGTLYSCLDLLNSLATVTPTITDITDPYDDSIVTGYNLQYTIDLTGFAVGSFVLRIEIVSGTTKKTIPYFINVIEFDCVTFSSC